KKNALSSTLEPHLAQELPVAAQRDLAIRLGDDPLPAATAHLLEVESPLVGVTDRPREQLRPAGRHDDAAFDLAHDPGGLALLVRSHDHGPADREHPVEPARDDEPGQPA